jgi:hypothetical protein
MKRVLVCVAALLAVGALAGSVVFAVGSRAAQPVDVTANGDFTGKFKTKDYAQSAPSEKSKTEDVSLILTQSGVDLNGFLAMSGTTYNVTGKYGQLNLWLEGQNGAGDVHLTLSAHLDKKGKSIKGIGIIFSDTDCKEAVFSLKKSAQTTGL